MTAERIAAEACRLFDDPGARDSMSAGLAGVAKDLASDRDPMETAADWVERVLSGDTVHAE